MLLENKIVMGFDFGLTRIGVAIANTSLRIPHPLAIVVGKDNNEKMAKIGELIAIWQPFNLVVGMPSNDINKLDLVHSINKFINRLKHNFRLEVISINEDFTSKIASGLLDVQGIHGIKQKHKLDSLSAMIILENYFYTR